MRLSLLPAILTQALFVSALAAQPVYSTSGLGPGCGPTLTASFQPIGGGNNQLQLALTNAFPNSHTLTFWGVDTIAFQVPNSLCTLYTVPVWVHPDLTDGSGTTGWQRSWPTSIVGYFNIQTVAYRLDAAGNLEFELSNGLRIAHE